MEHTEQSKTTFGTLVRDNLMNKSFVMGVLVPIVIFAVLDQLGRTLLGTLLAGSWSVVIVAYEYIKTKKTNIFAVLAALFSVIGLVGSWISQDPRFYMASPIAVDFLLAVVFTGSVLWKKPLLQVFAEQSMRNGFPEALTRQPKFRRAWVILSLAWGVLSLSQAGIRLVLLQTVPLNVYFAVSSVYGTVTTPLLLLFSFWFPGWYWKRQD